MANQQKVKDMEDSGDSATLVIQHHVKPTAKEAYEA